MQSLLAQAVEHYAFAKELFQEWEGLSAARTPADVETALAGESETQQLAYLKRQIQMRTLGLGWVQYATKWSSQSDRKIGTVAHLKELLCKEILPEETSQRRLKKLPTEASPPHHEAENLGQLGTDDPDAMEIATKVWSHVRNVSNLLLLLLTTYH